MRKASLFPLIVKALKAQALSPRGLTIWSRRASVNPVQAASSVGGSVSV